MEAFEAAYDRVLNTVFSFTNPFKKIIIRTQCKVHKFINIRALTILKNDKYLKEYNFFNQYIKEVNKGAVWADQDYGVPAIFIIPLRRRDSLAERTPWN